MAKRFCCLILLLSSLGLHSPAFAAGVLDRLEALSNGGRLPHREFLPADQAFSLSHTEQADGVRLEWQIAPGYYLYRDRMRFEALTPGLRVTTPNLPIGEIKDDAEFGRVQIYRTGQTVDLAVTGRVAGERKLRVTYQGCAEDGICYPPIKKEVLLTGDSAANPAGREESSATQAPIDRLAAGLATQSLSGVIGWFFLAGLALAFTPCVFPMIPILSGIIVGQRAALGAARSFGLSLTYVLAMAVTYALLGLVAGLFGRNLQGMLQHPVVLVGFSALFVALALSMFGFFTLQLPSFLQTRLEALSRGQASGRLAGVAAMGVLSALIVGPCVAPPLAAALLYLSHQGSAVVGGSALFALGLGMGAPLLVLGASAGRWLPRAGVWMETVKHLFGVVFLGLAIWFLERIIPPAATLALWATLLIGSAIFLGALEPLKDAASGWQRLWKGMGMVLLCYGVVLIVGAAAGADNPLRPLAPLTSAQANSVAAPAEFTAVKGVRQLDAMLATARSAAKPVLVDFYADWCLECKRLERNTFRDPAIRARLTGFVRLRADVTAVDTEDQALLKRFELLGPPAVLVFDSTGRELRAQRLVGYADPIEFGALLTESTPHE
ncbi:MAG: protein-disulfide reductase DsbD [Gammaproteobacteria bacterium]|nr:protein-disulfide reductase DsbD [Gammaproteobacteria bacterium]